MSRETHISTEQSRSQTPPRLPVAHGVEKRSKSPGASSRQGPQASFRISERNSSHDKTSAANSEDVLRVERLRARREFLFVAKGWSERRKSVVVQARLRQDDDPMRVGAGFTATKKIGGAVIRNRAKRRLREAAALLVPRHGRPGADYVFIARRDTAQIQWSRLLDDMESALISLRNSITSGKPPESKAGNRKRPGRRPGTGMDKNKRPKGERVDTAQPPRDE